jgi:BASS family bile acid:Na+ symporter
MSEILEVILNLSVLVFVITSMLAMGLSLTIKQIIEPLRNTKLVILALVVNFILVPILAYLIQLLISMDPGAATGLIIISTAAGAPFLPKLAQAAKGNMAFSVGLMTLLMLVTIIYMPLVLPLLLQGVEINPWDIAQSLIIMMLIPLAIGLFVKSRYESVAESLGPAMSQTSTVAIALLMVTGIILNWSSIIGFIGTGAILAILIFLIVAFIIGFFSGGSDSGIRSVLGLGTAQRNLSAAMVVAALNFSDDPNVLSFILVAGLIGLVVLMVIGGELGRRSQVEAAA